MAKRPQDDDVIDAAAAYKDPRALPLAKVSALLDLVYFDSPDITAAEQAAEDAARHIRNGQLRLLGYQHPRRLTDTPILIPEQLVRFALSRRTDREIYDPQQGRVIRPAIFAGKPPLHAPWDFPELAIEWREHQRHMRLRPATDFEECRLYTGRYLFVNCKAIRAANLAELAKQPADAAKGQSRRPGAPPGKRRAPKDAIDRLSEMVQILGLAHMEAAEAAEVIITEHREVLYSRHHKKTDEEIVFNPKGWWRYNTLVRNISKVQPNKHPR